MAALLALAALLPSLAAATTCVQFDSNFNLYAFGGEKDVALGPSSSWGSPSTKELTTTGRPPFNGDSMQCLLSQFNNAMYVVGADKSDVGTVYVYDFDGDAWSKQSTSGAPAAISDSRSSAILDHDTNVIFSLPGGGNPMVSLDMGNIKNQASGTLAWQTVGTPPFDTANYATTAALANNHINFFGVPNVAEGEAELFVIHFGFFQPQTVKYPTVGGGSPLPATSGQAVSFPTAKNTSPQSMLFVPHDFSNSYVVTHWTNPANYNLTTGSPMAANLINSTQILPAPSSKDKAASYACSPQSVVQLDSKGDIYYIADALGSDFAITSGATWSKMGYSVTGTAPSTPPATSAGSEGAANNTANPSASDIMTPLPGSTSPPNSPSGSHTGSPVSDSAANATDKPKNGAPTLGAPLSMLLGALALASIL